MNVELPTRPRILLIRLSSLGDVLACLPAAGALRARFPDAHIAWAVDDRFADLVAMEGAVDEILSFPRSGGLRAAAGFLTKLSGRPYDAAVDLHGNLRSGLIAWCSRAPVRIGHGRDSRREANGFFTNTHPAPDLSVRHRTDRAAALLRLLGSNDALPPMRLAPDADLRARALATLARDAPGEGKLAILHPGSSAKGAYKRWAPDRFAELGRRLSRRGLRILWFGGPADADLASSLAGRIGSASAYAALGSIPETLAVLSIANLYVGSDSGPAYLAAAAGVPTLILYGPKDPADYGPLAGRCTTVYHPLPCSPCRNTACPHVRCMDLITADEVEEKALGMLNSTSSTPAGGPAGG